MEWQRDCDAGISTFLLRRTIHVHAGLVYMTPGSGANLPVANLLRNAGAIEALAPVRGDGAPQYGGNQHTGGAPVTTQLRVQTHSCVLDDVLITPLH